jgi:hypothetical protein
MLHMVVLATLPGGLMGVRLVAPFPTIAERTSTTELTRSGAGKGKV